MAIQSQWVVRSRSVTGMRYDANEIAQGVTGVPADDTAVVIEPLLR
jgi:hypothetical protein